MRQGMTMGFSITMPKTELIAILNQNLVDHKQTYNEAIEIYREKMVDDLNKKIDLIKAGKHIEHYIRLPVPEEHTEDYEDVLEMLGHDINDEIDLDQSTYKQYVKNDWAWQHAFMANTASYTAGAHG